MRTARKTVAATARPRRRREGTRDSRGLIVFPPRARNPGADPCHNDRRPEDLVNSRPRTRLKSDMSQIFNRSTNAIARLAIWGAVFILAGAGWAASILNRSAYNTNQGVTVKQPVPFGHEHHVAGLGLDCRYCHSSVEKSASAGIPPTTTCMNCHKLIWNESPMLEPVRESFRTGKPLNWRKVYDLPDFVYFDHSIHVAKGVGCASCHGRIDKMHLTAQFPSLQMEWCIACHRNPEKFLRPKDKIFDLAWVAADQETLGKELAKQNHLRSTIALTNCSPCHR